MKLVSPTDYRSLPFRLGLAVLLWLSACSGTPPAGPAGARLKVLSTVSPIVNLVYNIGGDRIDLVGTIPEGTDSHTFEPAPSDANRLAQADLIFVNGLDLETATIKLAQANRKASAEILSLGEMTLKPEQYAFDFSFPRDQGKPNPHLWLNPQYALRYAEIVRDTLARRDPANSPYYSQNYGALQARMNQLDAAIQASIATIPPKNRKLLTYHDSFAYLAPRYGLTVMGAIQPSNFSEPSPKEVANLITQIKQEGVPAIFGSEVFPSKVLAQIGRESGAQYIDTLRDDVLPGAPGDPRHSYLGMMVEDVETMTRALGGNPAALQQVDTTNIPGSDQNISQSR